jgi:predicted nucleic-acid-binding Zn-ribbon protein
MERIFSNLCEKCHAAQVREESKIALAEIERREKAFKDLKAKRYSAAIRGKCPPEDLKQLENEGYLVAGGRLIRCPVCDHDRFDEQEILMNTRGATFLGFDWLNNGADARICERCKYVMWFAR